MTGESIFKGINIRSERRHPVGVEGLLDIFLLGAVVAHLGEAEVYAVVSFHFCKIKKSHILHTQPSQLHLLATKQVPLHHLHLLLKALGAVLLRVALHFVGLHLVL